MLGLMLVAVGDAATSRWSSRRSRASCVCVCARATVGERLLFLLLPSSFADFDEIIHQRDADNDDETAEGDADEIFFFFFLHVHYYARRTAPRFVLLSSSRVTVRAELLATCCTRVGAGIAAGAAEWS